uniref:TPR_REGION domain-containing protein n=1 Tax=Steinernema glaseri TaxID=37863 RepID=A0A1I7YGD3_9BILA
METGRTERLYRSQREEHEYSTESVLLMPFITESERDFIFAGIERGSKYDEDLRATIHLIEEELEKGDPAGIEEAFELAVFAYPSVTLFWHNKYDEDLRAAIHLIEEELEKGDPAGIEEAFELAVFSYPTVTLFWHKYLGWLDNCLKDPRKAVDAYERAVMVNPKCPEIMQLALIAYESAGESADRIDEVWEAAKNSIADPWWGRSLFTTYIFLLKRRVVDSGAKDFSIVEEAFKEGTAFLSQKFKHWDATFNYRLMHAYFLYSTAKDVAKARDIVRDILTSGGNTQPKVVIEAITFERHFGHDLDFCRHMLQQAVGSVAENAQLLFDYFIQFEREEGTLDDLMKAVAKVNSQADRVQLISLRRSTASPREKKDAISSLLEDVSFSSSTKHALQKLQSMQFRRSSGSFSPIGCPIPKRSREASRKLLAA